MKFTSIYTIFLKLKRDYGLTEINQSDVIEWSAEALEAIGAIQIMQRKLKLLHVKNHKAQLPAGMIDILQLHRVNGYQGKCLCDETNTMITTTYSTNKITVIEGCQQAESQCKDIIYIKDITGSEIEFKPIRKATSTLFLKNSCEECLDKDDSEYSDYGYDLYMQEVNDLVFSFKEGIVALTYYSIPIDNDGFPLIPDIYPITNAVTKYIAYKYFSKVFYSKGDKTDFYKMSNAKQEWETAVKQAANYAMMPDIDDLQNMFEVFTNPYEPERYYQSFKTLQQPRNKPLNRV